MSRGPNPVLSLPCSDNPTIMDYIKLKHDVTELEKQASEWRRKLELQQVGHGHACAYFPWPAHVASQHANPLFSSYFAVLLGSPLLCARAALALGSLVADDKHSGAKTRAGCWCALHCRWRRIARGKHSAMCRPCMPLLMGLLCHKALPRASSFKKQRDQLGWGSPGADIGRYFLNAWVGGASAMMVL